VWWRLLPVIMGVYLLGWLGSEVTLRVATIAGDISAWLALALFAFSFVCTLAAAIVILTLAGRELGISQLLPEDEREIDDRDTSLSHLLEITLLPFLALYAAFGQVAEAAHRLVTQQWVRYGFLSDQQTILGALYDLATGWLPYSSASMCCAGCSTTSLSGPDCASGAALIGGRWGRLHRLSVGSAGGMPRLRLLDWFSISPPERSRACSFPAQLLYQYVSSGAILRIRPLSSGWVLCSRGSRALRSSGCVGGLIERPV
jgi:hypothetical protein